jgi:hypothetical protein
MGGIVAGWTGATTQALASDSAALPARERFARDDVRHYGIVPNDRSSAVENTRALKNLCSPEVSPRGVVGRLRFVNSTGSDTYFFDDVVTFRDGIELDLDGCTLDFTKTGPDPHAQNAGFLYAIRDFSVENGTIDVHFAGAGGGQGSAIAIGSRNAAGTRYFPNHYDGLLRAPQGNVSLRNLTVRSDNPNAKLILLLGGLENVVIENLLLVGRGR